MLCDKLATNSVPKRFRFIEVTVHFLYGKFKYRFVKMSLMHRIVKLNRCDYRASKLTIKISNDGFAKV